MENFYVIKKSNNRKCIVLNFDTKHESFIIADCLTGDMSLIEDLNLLNEYKFRGLVER